MKEHYPDKTGKVKFSLTGLVPVCENEATQYVFATISPPSRVKIMVTRGKRRVGVPYDVLTQDEQRMFLISYFTKVYLHSMHVQYVAVFEHNKAGNLHMHMLLYSTGMQNEVELQRFQRLVNSHQLTLKYAGYKNRIRMNNIVFCDDLDETIKYLEKDIKQTAPYYGVITHSVEEKEYVLEVHTPIFDLLKF